VVHDEQSASRRGGGPQGTLGVVVGCAQQRRVMRGHEVERCRLDRRSDQPGAQPPHGGSFLPGVLCGPIQRHPRHIERGDAQALTSEPHCVRALTEAHLQRTARA
jgi:hypothetical protein